MKRFLLLVALCSSPALADGLDTFTFLPQSHIPSFTVPSDAGPQFSLTLNGTQWNFLFTDGDHFGDVDYTALYVSTGTAPAIDGSLFDFPYYCAPWNTGRSAVGIPWDRSTQEFVPGDYKHDYRYS
jgi:hypothetical protein